jgi:hypothetical protein
VNIESLRRQIRRMRATLAREDDIELRPGGGMRSLREAMALALARRNRELGLIEEAAVDGGHALPPVPANPAEAMAALRADMLAEQARRKALFEKTSIEAWAAEPAIHDDNEPDDRLNGERGDAPASEECEPCTAPRSLAPETHNQDS